MARKLLLVVFLNTFVCSLSSADISLPIHSLRDQSWTSHCWAYAMSHALESRALDRESISAIINIEQDIKYWVDYERMLYIYQTKKDFYMSFDYEGAWPIEYFEAALKHGLPIYSVAIESPTVPYETGKTYSTHLDFIPYPRPEVDPTLDDVTEVIRKLKEDFATEEEALAYITNYLGRVFGEPATVDTWLEEELPITATAEKLLGSDYPTNNTLDDLDLVVPVSDGNYGWVPYLDDRYLGYRHKRDDVLALVEFSLENHWPVPFDNTGHAMTIIGYANYEGDVHYAVTDSAGGMIEWYSSSRMLNNLHHLYFFMDSIPGKLPPRPDKEDVIAVGGVDYDILDGFITPPGYK